ncbi:MAG: hypothetical protein J6K73_02120 [Clostridia bacterium]|nr:hypothetical protein [Clostridia bacterium]
MDGIRLIDADVLEKDLRNYADKTHFNGHIELANGILKTISKVDEAPTIDAEIVRHGRWIVQKVDDIRTKFYCSECERSVWCGNDYFMKPTNYVAHVYPYCHCGAKMD